MEFLIAGAIVVAVLVFAWTSFRDPEVKVVRPPSEPAPSTPPPMDEVAVVSYALEDLQGMTKAELKIIAENAGIDIDGRWGKARIAATLVERL